MTRKEASEEVKKWKAFIDASPFKLTVRSMFLTEDGDITEYEMKGAWINECEFVYTGIFGVGIYFRKSPLNGNKIKRTIISRGVEHRLDGPAVVKCAYEYFKIYGVNGNKNDPFNMTKWCVEGRQMTFSDWSSLKEVKNAMCLKMIAGVIDEA